jgi:hypothetical protein
MVHGFRRILPVFFVFLALISLEAGSISRQSADAFSRKIATIQQQGTAPAKAGTRKTSLTQDEVNSWFAFAAQPLLPAGIANPQVSILGQGKLSGQAIVDLEAVAKRRSSGSLLDPFSLLGGRVPVAVTGILHTQNGKGRFEVQTAHISGVPVPTTMLQELLSYYSRSPERPAGVRLDGPFELPAKIRQIEVGQGQAVVVQ